jgi:chaperone required for assembly of F1-ATPase
MKKFWKTIEIEKISSKEFYILLDNKKLKTPLKNELILSNHLMAKEVLKEWDQSSDIINADDLVFYGLLSTAIDRVREEKNSYINDIINFIDTDLICYRADSPIDLVSSQNKHWDPIILLIEKYIDTNLTVFKGVMPSQQNLKVHHEIKKLVDELSDIQISVLHRITNLVGSVFLSLCILKKDLTKKKAYEFAFLDELWQAKNWGYEEEASIKRNKIRIELNRLIHFIDCMEI